MLCDCQTAKEGWEKLEAVHKAKSYARRLQLRQALSSLKKEPKESIAKYVDRARCIYRELLTAGHKIESSEVTFSVLAG
jgi:outer membrane protein assembly factor BamD (BamD/ComL family)